MRFIKSYHLTKMLKLYYTTGKYLKCLKQHVCLIKVKTQLLHLQTDVIFMMMNNARYLHLNKSLQF